MPSQLTNYQCPSCTGPLHYSEQSGKLECDYCGSSYTVEEVEKLFAGKNEQAEHAAAQLEASNEQIVENDGQWDLDGAGTEWGADAANLRAYSCPSCGAELICESTTAATACPYCGNPTVIPGQLSGSKKPDLIIPFQLNKDAAIAALQKHYCNKPLLPRNFTAASHIQEVKGIYVPFWLFDATVDASMTFDATRSFVRNTAKEIITETDHFVVLRKGSISFKNVPVDGSSKMPDGHMDAIEPFDYNGLKPFSLSYLPGFLADKYDVTKEESARRADQRCAASAEEAMRSTVTGYDGCITTGKNILIHPEGVRYALLPVWMLSTQWNGQNFLFAMNGQTGKLIGDLPIDKTKLAMFCAGAFAAVTAITAVISALL